jgi:hypothetical protein
MLKSFIAEPESPVFVEENCTEELIWELMDCDWTVNVVTDSFILHPNQIPELVPIKIDIDYNVTETCQDDRKIVHFSIVFNENVLSKSIEYVVCKIYRSSDIPPILIESRVNFTNNNILPFSSESTSDAETTTTTEPRSSSCTGAIMATTTGSAYNLSIHFMTITLGLIVANFFSFLWNH